MAQEYVTTTQTQGTTPATTVPTIQTTPSRRRDRLETYFDILQALEGGPQKPTRIMYRANLSWAILQEYMKTLEAKSLVVSDTEGSRRFYRLSEKGFGVLNEIRSITESLAIAQE
jgi:predicted transcriptional regulator